MNIYAKTAAATVVVKRQTSQTSGYQLRYATNSKLKNAKTITVKGNKQTQLLSMASVPGLHIICKPALT